ncbi:MAG TPA: hypothetical protein VNO22_11070 [Planctomycetota bacterium]|nr:hypothetical protein [Planctomycetota bacterium]
MILPAIAAALCAASQAAGSCDAARKTNVEFRREVDSWLTPHLAECTLCSGGTCCREGFDRREAARRKFEEWKSKHAPQCAVCAAKLCGMPDHAWSETEAAAKERHRERCRKCEFDPARCEAWRKDLEEARARHEEWKREHAVLCDKCGPECDEWRRVVQQVQARAEDAVRKHRDRCGDCRAAPGSCERSGQLRQEAIRDRLAAWKKHQETCPACVRGPKLPASR